MGKLKGKFKFFGFVFNFTQSRSERFSMNAYWNFCLDTTQVGLFDGKRKQPFIEINDFRTYRQTEKQIAVILIRSVSLSKPARLISSDFKTELLLTSIQPKG